jgi:hypothetical protein
MAIDRVFNSPWTRKHDDPRFALIPQAPEIVYPTTLVDLIDLCKNRPADKRLKAAGSHWGLSHAAISDNTFLETHDPRNMHQAMTKTLHDVIPHCLNMSFLQNMVTEEDDSGNPTYLVHVESGKRIYQLYSELDVGSDVDDPDSLAVFIKTKFENTNYGGSWGFATLGGAGGQTIVGAFNTGTHGGDFDRAPIADSVMAMHLVADGGKHYWIEPSGEPPLTNEARLRERYGAQEFGGPQNFRVVRDDNIFNALLVSAGRFGVIYSVVLRAVRQYALHERRRLHIWQDIKGQIKDRVNGPLYKEPAIQNLPTRFLQIAVCLTPIMNFSKNLVGVSKRWDVPLADPAPGRAERRGNKIAGSDPNNPKFDKAGVAHPFGPGTGGLLERACSDASFIKGLLDTLIKELEEFVESNGLEVGAGIGAIGAAGGGGLLALIPPLIPIIALLREILEEFGDDTRLGEALEKIKNELLDPNEPDPLKRAGGLFAWQLFAYLVFSQEQKDQDYDAISYAMMDRKDYKNISCEVNVDSVEVFFDAIDDRLICFVDALLAYEVQQEFKGKAFVGYASLRFMGPTRASLGMQKWSTSCAVEVACLRDVSGSQELIDYAVRLALDPNINGLLHWGQRNDYVRPQVESRYGPALTNWRAALSAITNNGQLNGFSSEFTRRTGLEVV